MLCDGRKDRTGGIYYNQWDRTRVETTWKDLCRKEKDLRDGFRDSGGSTNFQMNLANCSATGGFMRLRHSHNRMETVTEKEIKQSPRARSSLEGIDSNGLEFAAIKHLAKLPTDKWDMPMTTSQDPGWLITHPVHANSLLLPRAEPKRSRIHSSNLEESLYRMPPLAVPHMSVPSPANEDTLRRTQSAPSLPKGPDAPELGMLNNRRWRRPKATCDVVQFAEVFMSKHGVSPFRPR